MSKHEIKTMYVFNEQIYEWKPVNSDKNHLYMFPPESPLDKLISKTNGKRRRQSNMKTGVAFIGTILLWVSLVSAFGGSEDRFIKKYAMMKIYESCFGSEVVRQIRKEMKAACTKCASYEEPPSTPAPASSSEEPQADAQAPSANSVYAAAGTAPNFDADKLHQAIMAYRPNMAQSAFRPQSLYPSQAAPVPNNFYSPMAFSNPNMQGIQGMQGGMPFFYPGYQQISFSPYGGFPIVGQQYYGGSNRMSRDMDIRGQIEAITSKMSGKVRNVTCVMQELGYLDENLEPNYAKINERIGNLPVNDELRRDMQDGVTFCQQFSQCVPEVKKDKSPLSRELIRPMFFFKCYKHKKLEACIMKDVREKYAGVADDDFESGDVELRRTGREGKLMNSDKEKEVDDLAASMYEFLYASDSGFDIDGIL
ncbi:unnamed protein product [Ceutorhynchus assimilis]|uniref:Uncharacterized protein n=1 Tax=Ceutorhynchus assimilis TaxID=467358 RepID=A0A9N9MRT4_9CUCU|nr:unnamed protein product [Ceutorhynchus assimilis]